ncbi:hypothetical protein D9M73_130970 [compost metagenome]
MVEGRSRPVARAADIRDPCHAGQRAAAPCNDTSDGGARSICQRIGPQRLFEQRTKIGEVGRLPEILLGNLKFDHQRRVGHRAEQRVEGLARLKIDRAIFHLDDDIGGEFPVERLEVIIRLFGAVFGILLRVDKRTPHHHATMRGERRRQHVGTIGMAAFIVLRAWLALGIGLHQKAAKIGNRTVDFISFRAPPRGDLRIERVCGLQPAQLDRRREPGREVHFDAVRAEDVGQGCCLGDIRCGEAVGLGVDVVEHGAVDADRSIGAGIIGVARVAEIGERPPIP